MGDKKDPHKKIETATWLGRPIIDPHHANYLERSAAVHEFMGGKSREDAEHLAHQKYRQQFHEQAAAHHLRGMKIAQAAGESDHSRKHRILYDLHMKALNLDPAEAVPAQIKAHLEQEPALPSFYKFKPHKGFCFLFQDKE